MTDQVFTVHLHHDGAFIPSPLRYVQGDEKQITDIDFEGMSFDDLHEVIRHLVHGIVFRLYYCPIRTPLNVGIKELKTDNDVKDFIRVGYENKWYVDLYVEHFNYDVIDFLNEEANGVLSSGSSDDEYDSSDECEEFDDVDFHTEGDENVVIKNLSTKDPFLNKMCSDSGMFVDYLDQTLPQTECEALDDPESANIDPSFKVKKGVSYPKHDPSVPWNLMKPILGMRYEHPEQLKIALANYGVANGYQLWFERNDWKSLLVYCGRDVQSGRCAGRYSNKKKKIRKNLFGDSPRPAKSAKTDASSSKGPGKSVKVGKSSHVGKKIVTFSQPIMTRSKSKLGEGCSTDGEGQREHEYAKSQSPISNKRSPKSPESPKWTRKKVFEDRKKRAVCGFRLWASWMSTEHSF